MLSSTQDQRNVELMWLTGRLAPDFKTIADFHKDNGVPIRLVCRKLRLLGCCRGVMSALVKPEETTALAKNQRVG